jgi:hypothetical protein
MKFFADLFNEFTIEETEVLWGLLNNSAREQQGAIAAPFQVHDDSTAIGYQ